MINNNKTINENIIIKEKKINNNIYINNKIKLINNNNNNNKTKINIIIGRVIINDNKSNTFNTNSFLIKENSSFKLIDNNKINYYNIDKRKFILINNIYIEHTFFSSKSNSYNSKQKLKLSKEDIIQIYLEQGFQCQYCLDKSDSPLNLTLDHFIPKSKGGENIKSNLNVCCLRCNSAKNDNIKNFDNEIDMFKLETLDKLKKIFLYLPKNKRNEVQNKLFECILKDNTSEAFSLLGNVEGKLILNNKKINNSFILDKYINVKSYKKILCLLFNTKYSYYGIISKLILCSNSHYINKLKFDGIIEEYKLTIEEKGELSILKNNISIMKFYKLSDTFSELLKSEKYQYNVHLANNPDVYNIIKRFNNELNTAKQKKEEEIKFRLGQAKNQGVIFTGSNHSNINTNINKEIQDIYYNSLENCEE